MKSNTANSTRDLDSTDVTPEVGSEGGTPGDVEIGQHTTTGVGSEAGETWRPADKDRLDVVHDESGQGRRSP